MWGQQGVERKAAEWEGSTQQVWLQARPVWDPQHTWKGDQKQEWGVQIWVHVCIIGNADPGSKAEFLRLWETSSHVAFTNGSVLSRWKRKDNPSNAEEQREGKSSRGVKKRVVSVLWRVGLTWLKDARDRRGGHEKGCWTEKGVPLESDRRSEHSIPWVIENCWRRVEKLPGKLVSLRDH